MTANVFSILSYVLISTFTPGPSNISSASLAVLHGYKNTLKYQVGLAIGVFVLMLLSGLFSTMLLHFFPALEPILRYVGSAYILYLAFGLLRTSYTFAERQDQPLEFISGLLLNLLNPKLVIYSFSLFSIFLASVTDRIALSGICLLLAAISFCATTVWALFGTAIQKYLRHPRARQIVNVLLSLTLVYTAITLTGIL